MIDSDNFCESLALTALLWNVKMQMKLSHIRLNFFCQEKNLIKKINNEIKKLTVLQENYVNNELKNELKEKGVILKKYKDLSENQRNWCNNFFTTSIFPLLTPLVVDPAHPFPFISNLSLNLAALIKDEEDSKNQFVRVKIPTKNIPRFIRIPNEITQLSN